LNNKDFYLQVLGLMDVGLVLINKNYEVQLWNGWMEKLSGFEADEVIGHSIFDVFPEVSGSRIDKSINKALKHNCPSILSSKLTRINFPLFISSFRSNEKKRIEQSILIKPMDLSDNSRCAVISISDISSSKLREKALREQTTILNKVINQLKEKDRHFNAIFENNQQGILIFDGDGSVINSNPAAEVMLGYNNRRLKSLKIPALIDELPQYLFKKGNEDKLQSKLPLCNTSIEMAMLPESGKKFPVELNANVIPFDNAQNKYFVFFHDITEKKQTEIILYKMARNDSLTGLPNRSSFIEELDKTIQHYKRRNNILSLFFLDLDRFKYVNDRFGHDVGNHLLIEVAKRLKQCVRSTDTVARLSGDEFAILLHEQEKIEQAGMIAKNIILSISKPFLLDGAKIDIAASIGISCFPMDGEDAAVLLRNADLAMYQSKKEGEGRYTFYTEEINHLLQQRLKMETELNIALRDGEFVIHYQPQYDICSGKIWGAEALLRWQHPQKGLIFPNEFIPIAEECGVINTILDWVLENALVDAKTLLNNFGAEFKISINLSPRQFADTGLPQKIEKILKKENISPESLILDITEGHLLAEKDHIFALLNNLRSMGVHIAIDDFGSGYSSLSTLRKLPIDHLKIDKEFLTTDADPTKQKNLLSSIINLAHSLELTVIAEGVENKDQYDLLIQQHCDITQGFYTNQAVAIKEFCNLSASNNQSS